jgi:hypothetical protein
MINPASPAMAYQRPGTNCSRNGPTSGTKLYFHKARSAESCLSRSNSPPQADPMRPGLAEDLIDVATDPDADLVQVGGSSIGRSTRRCRFPGSTARLAGNLAALCGERLVAHFLGHRCARLEHGQVERTDEADLAVPAGVKRVGLGAFEHAVGVAVAGDHEFDGLLDVRPEPTQKTRRRPTSGVRAARRARGRSGRRRHGGSSRVRSVRMPMPPSAC